MRKSKSAEEQIVFALRPAEAGPGVEETCREPGVSQAAFFRWKAKRPAADLSLDTRTRTLQDVPAKKP